MTTTAFDVSGGRPLRGAVRVPGDKSISHRALLLAARAEGTSTLRGLSDGDDVARTRAAVEAFGARVDRGPEATRVGGGAGRLHEPAQLVDVGNSGTAIRLLAGFCAAFPWRVVLKGDDSVCRRPMERVARPLRSMGAAVEGHGPTCLPPLTVTGGDLRGVHYALPIASAQVKSAVLLAGLGAEGETVVIERTPTRAHTEELLELCGAAIDRSDAHHIRLRPGPLRPFDLDVPGDPSQAAFWVVGACVTPGSDLTVENVYVGQARDGFLRVLERMGALVDVRRRGGAATCDIRARYGPLTATDVPGDEIASLVDEIPVLAVAAAVADGATVFHDVDELRIKETDRVVTITSELGAFGADVEGTDDGLVVRGGTALRGATVDSHGDHRIAMAMAVAGLAAEGSTHIEGWDAVATSYPGFERDLESCAS